MGVVHVLAEVAFDAVLTIVAHASSWEDSGWRYFEYRETGIEIYLDMRTLYCVEHCRYGEK